MAIYGPSLKHDLAPDRATQEKTRPSQPGPRDMMDPRQNGDQTPSIRVLFVSVHNSVRSLMAEALLRHLGGGRVEVHSAGAQPTSANPLALKELAEQGIDVTGLTPKSLDQFVGRHFDYVITLCDEAQEACPDFPGAPERILWDFPDPAIVENEVEQRRAFAETFRGLEQRLKLLLIIGRREQQGELY